MMTKRVIAFQGSGTVTVAHHMPDLAAPPPVRASSVRCTFDPNGAGVRSEALRLSRRALLIGGGAVAAQATVGCPALLAALQVLLAVLASEGVFSLAVGGVAIGSLIQGATKSFSQDDATDFSAKYQAKSHQGDGTVTYDFPGLPIVGDGKAASTLSADGTPENGTSHVVVEENPTDESITGVTIFDSQGNASSSNGDNVSYLKYLPDAWLPGEGLYLLGLARATYTRMECVTQSGKNIEIKLT